MQLEGRAALITGASRGIGAATARLFAAEGAPLVICGRSPETESMAARLRATGARVKAMLGDVRDEGFVKQLVQACRKEYGHLDVLVNNAGVLKAGRLGMIPTADVRELLEVNVVALVQLTQYALRVMDAARGPAIVNVASIAGTRGTEGLSAYSASKGAVVAFTRACAKELAPKGIRVNAVAPGYVDTEMMSGLAAEDRARIVERIRLGRIASPEEVAAAILHLASASSRYVTGQVLEVDGGIED
ncbi:MAG TPA: SDR family oxidoreductase [Terriglobales bacterium]|nr:SDR family oxidoreductase [Terriglobales bacterium]